MEITAIKFVQDFIRVTDDAFRKGWHERNGGNLSYRIKPEEVDLIRPQLQPEQNWISTEVKIANLAGEYFLVTGSGKYMRNVILDPEENIAIVRIDEKGENYSVVWGLKSGGHPTSEFPTHLMNHSIKKRLTGGAYRVIYHSHPANIIALTFVLPLEDKAFTREIWEMATECPVVFPQGIGVAPWMVPGGKEIALKTGELMKKYDVAIWAHHGIFCAGPDFDTTFGLMDTVEKSAEICVKVLAMGGKRQTISSDDFRALAKDFKVDLREEFLTD